MTTLPLTSSPTASSDGAHTPAGQAHRWRAGLPQTMRAEWTKLVSLRSTRWTLLVTAAGTLLVTFLATHGALHHSKAWYQGFDPTNQSLAGLAIGSLAMGVLGVLAISGEYGTGTIRSSLAAMPRRGVLLTAKVARRRTRHAGHRRSAQLRLLLRGPGRPSRGRAHGLARASRACCGRWPCRAPSSPSSRCSGWASATVIRHTAGAIAVFAGITFLVPILLHSISHGIARFAPELIFANSVAAVDRQSNAFSVTIGVVLMLAYCAASLGLGALLLNRRDA